MNKSELLAAAKPILFNTPMVQAILEGRKTVTRRVIKDTLLNKLREFDAFKAIQRHRLTPKDKADFLKGNAPYKIGDILYVRETWCKGSLNGTEEQYYYKADNEIFYCTWRPSIHMPKEAARIFLRVTDVSVERLQDITETQAIQEGISDYTKDNSLYKYAVSLDWWKRFHQKHKKHFGGDFWQDMPLTAKEAFAYLWNSILPKDSLEYFYINNPWVWVIEFKRLEVS